MYLKKKNKTINMENNNVLDNLNIMNRTLPKRRVKIIKIMYLYDFGNILQELICGSGGAWC